MMNRLRTVLVSVTAVAVTMMVLGSNARAQSVSTASPQNYLGFLQGLCEMKKGTSSQRAGIRGSDGLTLLRPWDWSFPAFFPSRAQPSALPHKVSSW